VTHLPKNLPPSTFATLSFLEARFEYVETPTNRCLWATKSVLFEMSKGAKANNLRLKAPRILPRL
jgi:hypothetical protein